MILNSALFPVNGEDQDSLVASMFGDIRLTHHLGQKSPFASREETPFLLEDKKKEPRGNCLPGKFDLDEHAHLGPADSANPGYHIRPLARHRPLSKLDSQSPMEPDQNFAVAFSEKFPQGHCSFELGHGRVASPHCLNPFYSEPRLRKGIPNRLGSLTVQPGMVPIARPRAASAFRLSLRLPHAGWPPPSWWSTNAKAL